MKLIVLFAFLLVATIAQAQTSSTAGSIKSVIPGNEQVQEKIDQEITNPKMRADFGSRSRWSMKISADYMGSTIERPFDQIRPDYRKGPEQPYLTSLESKIAARWALGPRDSLALGTGLSVQNPLGGTQGTFEDPRYGTEAKRYQTSTPYLAYSRAYRAETALGGLQMISTGMYAHSTLEDQTVGLGQSGALSFMQTVANEFGASGWTGGAQLMLYKMLYKGDVSPELARRRVPQIDFIYALVPFAEYSFNDRYAFRTMFGWFSGTTIRGNTDGSVSSGTPYQSVGLGISVTRDIYLYPNVQFAPLDLRGDRTNVALSSSINIF